jgi:hypothetical protein
MIKKKIDAIRYSITSLIGLAVMVVTLFGVFQGKVSWQWEATIGMSVGVLLLMVPDKLVGLIYDSIKKLITKNGSDSNPSA